jgi:beta-galactosidase
MTSPMKRPNLLKPALVCSLAFTALQLQPARAYESLGPGEASLLGGDLSDPEDTLQPNLDCGGGTEEALKPKNATWVKLTCFPANGPGEIGHQQHPYQSWVGTPASAIFWNMPEDHKWYVGFKDGGYGGPTDAKPYFLAIQLKEPQILTHFTISSSLDKPLRDPRTWAIQGSDTGKDGEWTDVYRCSAADRAASPFREYPRNEAMLFTSFTSAEMAKSVSPAMAKKITDHLKGKTIAKADFARPAKAYTWYRVATFSCFNGNTMDVPDPSNPPGFALGQLELFSAQSGKTGAGTTAAAASGTVKPLKAVPKIVKPTTVDPKVLAALPAPGTGELRKTLSLDGEWDIAAGGGDTPPAQFGSKIPVPGLVDLAKPGLGENGVFWYRKKFTVTAPLSEVAVIKVARAKYTTRAFLNGKAIGVHTGNFTPGYFDAKPAIKEGENELVIRIADHGATPAGAQWGHDEEKTRYTPGIYDSVQLILCGAQRILRVQAVPHIDSKVVTVHAWMPAAADGKDSRIHFTIRDVATGKVAGEGDCVIPAGATPERTGFASMAIKDCRLWSPEDPFLYELEARSQTDVLKTRFGMRSMVFEDGRAFLNGKPYFLRGTNVTLFRFFEDPMRADLPWKEDWVRQLFKAYRDVHWNSMRFSICQPPEKWYELADELGILVQDEFPIWNMYPKPGAADAANLEKEFTEWMQDRWNHPCVVIWDSCNETRLPETAKAIGAVRGLDFSDRTWDNGWAPAQRKGDIHEAHHYHYKDVQFKPHYLGRVPNMPKGPFRNTDKDPIILNEYGWLWLNRDGSPTTLTAEVYNNLLPGGTNQQRQKLHAKLLAQQTEFWRHSRNCAGIMEFCGLGYSRPGGQTSDHWTDVTKLTWEPEFYKYVRDSFAPVGVMVEAYEPEYLAGSSQDFPISIINDLSVPWEGTIRLRITKAGDSIAVKEEVKSFKTDAWGSAKVTFKVSIPPAGADYELEAALMKSGQPIARSYRDFKSSASVQPR